MSKKIEIVIPRTEYYELLQEVNSLKSAVASLHENGDVKVSDLHQLGFLVGRLYRLFSFVPQLDDDGRPCTALNLVTKDDPRAQEETEDSDEETNGDFH
tara:strand:- start:246 stop:542 length:297 start_codon:yes stop_codon:yes gene_type:complete